MCTGQDEGSSEGLCSWDSLSQQNHQGGQTVYLTPSVCREKGRGISGPLHQVQLMAWATGVLTSQAGGEEAALPLSPFAPPSVFCLAGWREKKGRRSHIATDLAMLPNKPPARAGSP